MSSNNRLALRKVLLMAGCAGTVALASPALAQEPGANNAGPSNNTGQGADCDKTPQDPRCIGNVETPSPTPSTAWPC